MNQPEKVIHTAKVHTTGGPTGASRSANAHIYKATMSSIAAKKRARRDRRSPFSWRITFDHPPLNIFGPQSIVQLNDMSPDRRAGQLGA